jgi:hypothetical protein
VNKTKIVDGKAMFVCPECFKAKTVDVSKQSDKGRFLKVNCKCPCGHSYTVILDKRKHDRVVITLPGVFVRYNKGKMGKREQMLVLDLSLSGLKFMMKRKCNIEVGEELMVEFNLNDKKKSLIKERVIAKHIKNSSEVGAEFCSREQQINIRPYLEGLRSKERH